MMAVRLHLSILLTATLALVTAACTPPPQVPDRDRLLSESLGASVQIFTQRETGGRRAGSAVVLASSPNEEKTTFITTAHTFQPLVEQSIELLIPAHPGRVSATLVAVDAERDLALMEATVTAIPPARMAPGARLVDPVWVVAYPWGRARTVVEGAVSQIDAAQGAGEGIPIRGPVKLIDASVSYGMSGGGIFHSRTGDLVGLVRGYRTANLTLDSRSEPLRLPVAGETTVVSSREITCFLISIDRQDLMQQVGASEPQAGCPDSNSAAKAIDG